MRSQVATGQMQCDADYKKADQEDQCFLYIRGNGSR